VARTAIGLSSSTNSASNSCKMAERRCCKSGVERGSRSIARPSRLSACTSRRLPLYVWDRIHRPVDRAAVGNGAVVRLANDGAVLFKQAAEARRRRGAVGGGAGSEFGVAQGEMDSADPRKDTRYRGSAFRMQ
jgi:hypothetical protein